jgi:RNA polymerase sigma-70 factor (ECF subfamily)
VTNEANPEGDRSIRRGEERLVARLVAGDEGAFDQLAADYFPVVFRFALRHVGGDEDLAAELVQATVCKAVTNLGGFRRESTLLTWLCACCRNEIRMYFRARGRRPQQVELEDSNVTSSQASRQQGGPERDALRNETSLLVHAALDQLPPRYAQVLEWKYIDHLGVREIAQRCDVGEKAAESLLTRAREAFRRTYDRLCQAGRAEQRGDGATTPNPLPSEDLPR